MGTGSLALTPLLVTADWSLASEVAAMGGDASRKHQQISSDCR